MGVVNVAAPDAKLSRQQRRILVHILHRHEAAATAGRSAGRLECFGAPWSTSGTRAEQASMSRALLRLEQRELVLRQNMTTGSPATGQARQSAADQHGRTTHVKLTPAGMELAKRLTSGAG